MDLTSAGHGLVFVGRPPGWAFHLQQLSAGIGIVPLAVGVMGLGYAAFERKAWAWVLLAFFLPTYVLLSSQAVMFLRYGFPLYIGVAAGFGWVISYLQRRVGNRWVAAGTAAIMLIGVESSQSGVRGATLFTQWMNEPAPQDQAGAYIKNIASNTPGMQIAIFGDSPWFYTASVLKDSSFLRFQSPSVREEYLSRTRNPHVLTFASVQGYPDYATYSSFEVEEALRLRDRKDIDISYWGDIQLTTAKVDQLNAEYETLVVFGTDGPRVHDLEYIRPTVWLLKRRT
jgi:hypothetical protein